MISHEKKFVFVHVPRTGGTALSNFLRPYCDEESLRFSPFVEEIGNLHASMKNYVEYYGKEILDYTIFTIVRNPWERALSHLIHHNGGKFDRDEFRKYIFKPQENGFWPHSHFHFFVKDNFGHEPHPDGRPTVCISYPSQFSMQGMKFTQEHVYFPHFVRFENYVNDLSKIFNKLQIQYEIKDLQRKINSTSHEHYSRYYLDDEKDHIAEVCGLDLQLLGYTFKDERKT
jgi:hypothetical protein